MGKTSNLNLLKCIMCFVVFGFTNTAFGQFNLKVGYAMEFTQLDQTKTIFERYNEKNPQAEQILLPNKFYHGLTLGFRYQFNQIGIDLSLTSVSRSNEALNVFQADGITLGDNDWTTSLVNYSFGIESYHGVFGYGATIGTQGLKYSTNFGSNSGKKEIFNESVLNSKFYLILEVPSNKVAFSIRPYVSTTWKPYNLQDVDLLLDPQSTVPAADLEESLFVYGITFLFYNGPQRK